MFVYIHVQCILWGKFTAREMICELQQGLAAFCFFWVKVREVPMRLRKTHL